MARQGTYAVLCWMCTVFLLCESSVLWTRDDDFNYGQSKETEVVVPNCPEEEAICLSALDEPLLHMFEFDNLVENGHLTINCDPVARTESHACVSSVSTCPDYKYLFAIHAMWEFMCEWSQVFIEESGCYTDSEFKDAMQRCGETGETEGYCSMPVCVEAGLGNVTACNLIARETMGWMLRQFVTAQGFDCDWGGR